MGYEMGDQLLEKIEKLKAQRNAVILAHNYQPGRIQDLADFCGDSLGLSIKAAETDAQVIVFCGVQFMAETAAILSPQKTVLLPEKQAGCPLADMISAPQLIKEGQEVEIVYHADTETPISVELPPFVELEVTYTEPGVRGDTTSTSSMKPATVETGANITVPLFINTGDKIKIDTRDQSYSERVK